MILLAASEPASEAAEEAVEEAVLVEEEEPPQAVRAAAAAAAPATARKLRREIIIRKLSFLYIKNCALQRECAHLHIYDSSIAGSCEESKAFPITKSLQIFCKIRVKVVLFLQFWQNLRFPPHSSTALLPATLEGPKPKGSSSSMLRSMKSSGVFAMMTFSSGPPNSNSA